MDFIFDLFEKAGLRTWLVGGAVRDRLMGITPSDLDFVVEGSIEQISSISGGKLIGPASDPLCILKIGDTIVEIVPMKGPNIRHDLSVRDITINSMAMDRNGKVIDPFGGQRDLCDRVIRFVGDGLDRLKDDSVRSIRFCRFLASTSFDAEERSWFELTSFVSQKGKGIFQKVANERIGRELLKGLEHPSVFIDSLHRARILESLLVKFNPSGLEIFHGVISLLDSRSLGELAYVVSAFFLSLEVTACDELMRQWAFPRELRRNVSSIIKCHRFFENPIESSEIIRLYMNMGDLFFRRTLSFFKIEASMKEEPFVNKVFIHNLDCSLIFLEMLKKVEGSFQMPSGKNLVDMGFDGPQIGQILEDVYLLTYRGGLSSNEDLMAYLKKELRKRRSP